jgi:hypothetical protein
MRDGLCGERQGLELESCEGCTQEGREEKGPLKGKALAQAVSHTKTRKGSKRHHAEKKARREFALAMTSEAR